MNRSMCCIYTMGSDITLHKNWVNHKSMPSLGSQPKFLVTVCHALWLRQCMSRNWHLTHHPRWPLKTSSPLPPPSSGLRRTQCLYSISPSLCRDSRAPPPPPPHPRAGKPELPTGLRGRHHPPDWLRAPLSRSVSYCMDHDDVALKEFAKYFLSGCRTSGGVELVR